MAKNKFSNFEKIQYIQIFYRNPTADCQTKATNKKNSGITGKISTIGEKGAYASGNVKIDNHIYLIFNYFLIKLISNVLLNSSKAKRFFIQL